MTKLIPFGKDSQKEYAYDKDGSIYERNISCLVWTVCLEKIIIFIENYTNPPKQEILK